MVDRQKSYGLYGYGSLHKVWMSRMNIGRGAEFLKSGNFGKVHQMTPNQTEAIGHQKYLSYIYALYARSQIFVRFALRLAIFEIFHILGFPIDSHVVKISKDHKTWPIAKKSDSLYSTMVASSHNVWLTWDEKYRRRSVLKLSIPYGPVLGKISNCHRIFNFGRSLKSNSLY